MHNFVLINTALKKTILLCLALLTCIPGFSQQQKSIHDTLTNDKLENLGLKIFFAFKTNDKDSLLSLYPTFEQNIATAQSKGHLLKKLSKDEVNYFKYNYQSNLDLYNFSCEKIISDAKKLNINWPDAIYIKSKIQQEEKDSFGILILLKSSDHLFDIQVRARPLADQTLKVWFYVKLEPNN